MRRIIQKENKHVFIEKVEELKGYLEDEIGEKRIEEAKNDILSNYIAARIRLRHKDGVKGCSAEGHVSHILSSRMSSRPMGWSMKGAAKMSQLRAYH